MSSKSQEAAAYRDINLKKSEKAKSEMDYQNAKLYASNAKIWAKQANILDKKLNDVNSGRIKAGRDFIIQRDYNVYPLGLVVYGNRTSTIIERKQ